MNGAGVGEGEAGVGAGVAGVGAGVGGGVGMGIDTPVTKSEGFLVHRVSLI